MLVLSCLMMVGSYFCLDLPAALMTQMDDFMGDPDDYEIKFGLLFSLYAAPNVSPAHTALRSSHSPFR